ncbi:hypothetical protein Pmani_019982 [Petrolisthes manimaculis]|uniref:Regulator of microtubule dynamics protein 1 n=1 Tax=Petrolisthes manimaculis TaxID=1843537 RepID=A0AAE1U6U8_9EUCA|nr:hypothetical protein Pmani_019982 [Petrolisthes manimaculis]
MQSLLKTVSAARYIGVFGVSVKARPLIYSWFQYNLRHTNRANKLFTTARIGLRLGVGVVAGIVNNFCSVVMAAASIPDSLLTQADALYDAMKYEEIYSLLYSYKDSQNDEVLWRLGRATYEMAKAAQTEEEKKNLYRKALDYVEAALAINPNNFAVHKWMSILIDYVYGYDGTKARISQSYNVKEHMLKACELNPTDGTSWYLLGYWYFSIASIPWYQRNIAAIIFATPPTGTFQEALQYFLHAEKVEPNFYSKNLLMIGKCYLELGDKEKAREFLQRTTHYTIKIQDDQEAVIEAENLLKKL